MVTSKTIIEDHSLISKIDQAYYRIERIMALASGCAVLGLMVMAVLSVGGRNLLNRPLSGYVDWIELLMPLIAVVGISFVQRDGGHIRMDIFIARLQGRLLYAVELATTIIILSLLLCLTWGAWEHFLRSFDFTAPLWSRDSSMDINLPLWPAKLLIPLSFGVLCGRLALQIWAYGYGLITGQNPPAVPAVEDAATQASRKAAAVT